VDAAPFQPVGDALTDGDTPSISSILPSLLDELWNQCDARDWGLSRNEFDSILLAAGAAQNFGQPQGVAASLLHQSAFFHRLKLNDLVLARACASSNERAWERFFSLYRGTLTRAAIAIAQSETVGRDLADALYAELYGLTEREGIRRCPLDSYRGRGSLLGWLRTTLAQRHVDHYRRTNREQPLDEFDTPAVDGTAFPAPSIARTLVNAISVVLQQQEGEERFLLAAYYLDNRTLTQIAGVLQVHEATISRRLRRATEVVRKQILHNLQSTGMSRRAAEEALGTDPRDIDLKMDLKRLMQISQTDTFSEKTPLAVNLTNETFPDKAKPAG
jgi:RNA polymerase sigma-70 factor (ECF subfamily)